MAGRSDANNPHSGEPDDELGELDNILADLQDESEKYGAGTKAKRKKPEKLVRWKKRDQYGRLIAETQQSSGGAGPSSRPKDTCPVHMVPCPDDASNYAPLQVQLQEAHKALDTQLQLLQESLEDDPLACSEGREMLTRTWDMRQTHSEEKWENARPNLLESMLSAEWTLDQSCDHCHTKRAVIRCRDCLPKHLFCSDCDLAVHRNYVLHNRDSLVEGFYKALPPTCHIVQDGSGAPEISEKACLLPIASPHNLCNCDTQDIAINAGRAIILVEINGRYDLSLPLVTCKSCLKTWTPGLKDLQSNGYWPGNVDFQTVYSTDVFHTFEEFKVSAPGLSRQAFVKMLDNRTSNFGRAGRISGDSFQRSFLEWTYCRHEKEKLLAVDHFSCPACMEDIAAISVDGNRKMYRFNRTKGTDESGYFDGAFFSKDKEVAEFVEGIRNRIRPESGRGVCGKSQWKAARETAKKSGSKVDEEGVEVAVCRHGILFKALNMFRGEIYAYPLFLQKEVSLGHNIQFFCTDIMCKYYPYLQKVCEAFPDLVPLLQMKPFLSVMHAKGHSGKCEVQWGGRNQEGAGMTVGEEVEQVNSFLSQVGLTTKYMTKSARTDMITLQARGWNMRKKSNLHEYLSQRYVKVGLLFRMDV
ncbi:uncharacterized protein LOC132465616 isoform X2 [Gadus macrocephalus]|uniref:uncharacterized protein LOC132465616 isoform X2 n=1 Tax=Gadus macrocephalus TaxID=80720 RepID=UPI0028CBAD1F|nr:uncharacterized protein LOC132465616 isoform X2 [Gadus macrocephalus]